MQSKTAEKTTPIFNVGKTSQKRLKNPIQWTTNQTIWKLPE